MADDQTSPISVNPLDSATNFRAIGEALAAGLDGIGAFEKLAKAQSDGRVSALRKMKAYGIKIAATFLGAVAGAIFDLISELDPAFGSLAATIVGNMFEIGVDGAAFSNLTENGGRKAVAEAVGAALLTAMKGDQADAGAGELQPSTTAATAYLGTMTNMAIEGWTFGVIGALFPDLQLEELGELKDAMARVLGLGRLSRTVLHPFVNTLIANPALWSVNKQYRPKMLSVSEALHAWRRGLVDEPTVFEIGARDGYGDDAITALRDGAWSPLSPADAYLLQHAGVWQLAEAQDELRVSHVTDDRIALALQLEDVKALHRFELDMVTAAAHAYAEHRIDNPTFQRLLTGNTLDATAIGRINELASQRRIVNAPHLSETDVITAVKRGVLNVTDYAAWLSARGYSDVDAVTKELVLQDELNEIANKAAARSLAAANRAAAAAAKQQAAQAKRDATAAAHAHWSGTLGEAERLVVRNVMPPTTYRQVLIDHGIAPSDADELVTVATADRDARAATLAKRASAQASAKTPALAIGTLTHAILLGARSIDDLIPAMLAAGFNQADAQLEHDLVSAELVQKQAAAAARAKTSAAGTSRALTLAQLERAVLSGSATLDAYRAAVIAAGYSVTDTATLVADLTTRIEARKFADERHALAEQRLAASHLPLATEEKAVVDGFQTLTDYQAYLAAHGFDASDQAILADLLKLKLPPA